MGNHEDAPSIRLTVDLGGGELTDEELEAIKSDIVKVIQQRIGEPDGPGGPRPRHHIKFA
jgi:hypothetical protein